MCVRVRENTHVCVRARVLHASHQQQGFVVGAVCLSNLMGWTTRATGHPVCTSIVSTDHVDMRTPWKQEVITSAFLQSNGMQCGTITSIVGKQHSVLRHTTV